MLRDPRLTSPTLPVASSDVDVVQRKLPCRRSMEDDSGGVGADGDRSGRSHDCHRAHCVLSVGGQRVPALAEDVASLSHAMEHAHPYGASQILVVVSEVDGIFAQEDPVLVA